jgi:hypothetical protein
MSPVFAEDSPEFITCQQMQWKEGKKAKKDCFRDFARDLSGSIAVKMDALEIQLNSVTSTQESLTTRVADLESHHN